MSSTIIEHLTTVIKNQRLVCLIPWAEINLVCKVNSDIHNINSAKETTHIQIRLKNFHELHCENTTVIRIVLLRDIGIKDSKVSENIVFAIEN